jgi:hypothetical protein
MKSSNKQNVKHKQQHVESLQSHMILTGPVSDILLHWWPRCDWSSTGLRSQLSLGPCADNVTVPLDLTQLSCPGFTLAAGLPSGFTTTESAAGREPCGEPAISHDSHHVSLVQWTNLFASRHKGHRFKSPGGYLFETGILLLALSRYKHLLFLHRCTVDMTFLS